ncbi:uncharacterized protein LOC123296887 [Chrysoperla carnea]|uniref:uncharacterized protein LOC123296887 n=1 Tax=Chrysoperla carnea TaxID=189513 RepID=UPI001D06830F|nr:uncharacterized protein LOC123296887 [Chrysoperla carnea]
MNYIVILLIISSSIMMLETVKGEPEARIGRRFRLPNFLNLNNQRCTGCPSHYCNDDPAIIHGYCCGCARLFESLPISCPGHLSCPLDTRGLCRDYEYMMNCCC